MDSENIILSVALYEYETWPTVSRKNIYCIFRVFDNKMLRTLAFKREEVTRG
jgi:hypothetical protein